LADPKKVVGLLRDSNQRDPLQKVLMMENYSISFCSNTDQCNELLNNIRPDILIHDIQATDESQGKQMQLSLYKRDLTWRLIRILIVPVIDDKTIAFASDAGIHKVIHSSTSVLGIVTSLELLKSSVLANESLQIQLKQIRLGVKNYNQLELDQMIRDSYTKFPNDQDIQIEYGGLLLRKGDLDNALQVANTVIKANPLNVRAMNMMARILAQKGDLKQSIEVLKRANFLSPDNPDRLIQMGQTFFKDGNLSEAKKHFKIAHQIEPTDPEAIKGLGVIAIEEGDADSLGKLFTNTLSEEETASFFNNQAVYQAQNNNPQKAVEMYAFAYRVLKTPSYKPQILLNLALCYQRLGNYKDAIITLKKVLKLNPDYTKAKKILYAIENNLKKSS
jgi:tetratricopeptide (TPR) repeat protein